MRNAYFIARPPLDYVESHCRMRGRKLKINDIHHFNCFRQQGTRLVNQIGFGRNFLFNIAAFHRVNLDLGSDPSFTYEDMPLMRLTDNASASVL
jgi:hypothetical protein